MFTMQRLVFWMVGPTSPILCCNLKTLLCQAHTFLIMMVCIDSDDPNVHEPVDVGEDKIRNFVLRRLLSKIKFGWSQTETMAQIRNFHEIIHDERIPQKPWQSVIAFLKKLGYQDPRHYKISCSEDHVHLPDYQIPCNECDEDWSSCTDHYLDIFLD